MAVVEKNDIKAWCQSFLAALERVTLPDDPSTWRQPEAIRNALESARQPAKPRGGPTAKVAAAANPPE
jgi:hypothetical protein